MDEQLVIVEDDPVDNIGIKSNLGSQYLYGSSSRMVFESTCVGCSEDDINALQYKWNLMVIIQSAQKSLDYNSMMMELEENLWRSRKEDGDDDEVEDGEVSHTRTPSNFLDRAKDYTKDYNYKKKIQLHTERAFEDDPGEISEKEEMEAMFGDLNDLRRDLESLDVTVTSDLINRVWQLYKLSGEYRLEARNKMLRRRAELSHKRVRRSDSIRSTVDQKVAVEMTGGDDGMNDHDHNPPPSTPHKRHHVESSPDKSLKEGHTIYSSSSVVAPGDGREEAPYAVTPLTVKNDETRRHNGEGRGQATHHHLPLSLEETTLTYSERMGGGDRHLTRGMSGGRKKRGGGGGEIAEIDWNIVQEETNNDENLKQIDLVRKDLVTRHDSDQEEEVNGDDNGQKNLDPILENTGNVAESAKVDYYTKDDVRDTPLISSADNRKGTSDGIQGETGVTTDDVDESSFVAVDLDSAKEEKEEVEELEDVRWRHPPPNGVQLHPKEANRKVLPQQTVSTSLTAAVTPRGLHRLLAVLRLQPASMLLSQNLTSSLAKGIEEKLHDDNRGRGENHFLIAKGEKVKPTDWHKQSSLGDGETTGLVTNEIEETVNSGEERKVKGEWKEETGYKHFGKKIHMISLYDVNDANNDEDDARDNEENDMSSVASARGSSVPRMTPSGASHERDIAVLPMTASTDPPQSPSRSIAASGAPTAAAADLKEEGESHGLSRPFDFLLPSQTRERRGGVSVSDFAEAAGSETITQVDERGHLASSQARNDHQRVKRGTLRQTNDEYAMGGDSGGTSRVSGSRFADIHPNPLSAAVRSSQLSLLRGAGEVSRRASPSLSSSPPSSSRMTLGAKHSMPIALATPPSPSTTTTTTSSTSSSQYIEARPSPPSRASYMPDESPLLPSYHLGERVLDYREYSRRRQKYKLDPFYPQPPVSYGKNYKHSLNMQDANYNSELGFEGGLNVKRSDAPNGFAKIDGVDLAVIPPPVNAGSEEGHVSSSEFLAGRKVDSNSRLEEDSTRAGVSATTLPSKEGGRGGVLSPRKGSIARARPWAKKGTDRSKPLEGDRRAEFKDDDADVDGDGGWASLPKKPVGSSFSRDVTEGSTGSIRTLSYGDHLKKYANATGEVPDFSCAPDHWHECRQISDSRVANSTLRVLLKTLGDPAEGDGAMRETSIEKESPFITEESQMNVFWFRRLTSTGLHQPVLVIYDYKDLLIERFSYVLHLKTFNPRTERNGYAKQVIRFSPTPTLENCQIVGLPTRKNWFQASCQNVDGKFHPVYLQWSYQFMKSKTKTILYHGSKTSIQFPLPSGTDANGYTRYVSVKAIDGKGVASWFPKSFEAPVLPRSSGEEILSLFKDISSLVNENPSLFLQEVRTLAYELNLLEDSDLAETILDNILALTFYRDRCENNLKEAAVNPSSSQSLSQSIHRESHGSSTFDLIKSVNLLIACARDHLAEKIVELPVRDEMEVLQVLSALQMTVDAQMTADAKKSISSITYSKVISAMQKASLKMWWNYKAELRTEAAKQYFLLSSSVLDAQTSIYDWDSSFAQLSGLVIKMLFNVMKVETTARFREESPLSYSTSTLAFMGYVSDSKTINLWNKSVPYYFEPGWIHHRAHMVQSLVHQRSPYLVSNGESVSSQVVNIDLDLKNSLMKAVKVRLLRTLESTGLEDYDFRREGVLTPQSLNVYEFEVGKEHEDMTFSVVLQVVQVFNSKYPVAAVVLICEDLEELHNPMYKKEVTATVVFSQVQLNVPAGALSRGTKLLVIMDKNVYENNWARHNKSSENQGGKFKVAGWWSECLVWNDTNWVSGDCSVVEDSTTWDATTCRCESVHSVYGAKVIPILEEESKIDVNELMLVETYGALYFIITVLIIYFVLVIVLQTSERHRLKRRNIWLRDNKPGHEWAYLLTIKTGTQWNAGTTSKVYAIIHGTHGMSETRELQSSQTGQLFTRGSLCTFILTTAENLGDILKVQVWHDNSGGNSSSWYVCETSVADLVMGAMYAYPCYRWLSVHAEDAKVEREITLESPTTFFQDFEHFLPQYASEHMLWSSLLTTSNTAKFFRLQRLTICLIVCLCLGTVSLAVVQMINDEHTMMVPDMHIESLLFGFMIAALLLPIQWLLEMIFKMSNRLEEKEYNNKTVLDTLRPIVEASPEKSLYRDSPADNSDEDDSCELLDPNAPVWSRLTEWANSVEMLNCHTSVLHPALHQYTTDNVLSKRIPSAASGPMGVTSETPETSITTELPQMTGAGECLSSNRLENPEESDAKKCSPLATYQFYSELSKTFGYLFAFFKKPKKPKYKKRTSHSDEEGWTQKEEEEDEEEEDTDENFSLKSNIAFIFSQCIGWIVCCVFFALCCMFLFVRGSGMPADYGALWVHIIYVSLCCSIFIMQPLVIVIYTLYKVCMYRWLGCRGCISNCVTVPLDQVVSIWNHYQSVLSRNNRTNTRADKEKLFQDRQRKRDLRFAHPPAEDYLLKCREKELRQESVSRLFVSTLGHILLLALLLIISSKANVTERFRLNQAIHNAMVNGSCLDKERYLDPCTEAESYESCNLKKNPNYMSFKDITTKDEWWKWANSELLALTYNVDSDYTSYAIFCDTSSIIIGTPRLRKYVMKSEECVASKFKFDNNTSLADLLKLKKCYPDYIDVAHIFGFNGIDNKEYEWDAHFLAIIQGMFSQYSYTELKQYLPSNRLSAVFLLYLLGSQNWIDVSTRAVLTEFTLYHPTSKIYTTINMLAEFPSVSGVKVTTYVWSTDVERYRGGWAYVCMCGEILLLAIAMYYLYHSTIYLYSCQFRVWQSFWGMLDLLMTFFSWSYVICLMLRVQIAEDITWQLQVAYFRTFVNLKSLVTWDDILEAKMGIMVAVHSLRCLELLKYIPRLRRLGLILAGAAKDVLVISVFLLLMLVCCIFLGYLWFNTVLWEFHTITEVVLTTFRILIAHLPFLNYIEENTSGLLAVLGKLYYLVNFVLLFQLTRSLFVAAFIYSHKSYVAVSSTDIKLDDIQKYFMSKWEFLKQKITNKEKDVDINRKDTVPPDFYMAEIEMQISQVQNSLNSLASSLGLILEQIPDFEDSSLYCDSLSSNEDRSRARKLSGDSNSSWKPEEFKVGQVKSSTFKSELEKLLEPLQNKVLEIVNQEANQDESGDIFEGLTLKGENVEERGLDTTFNMDAFTDIASCQTEIEALSRKWNLASLSSTIKVQAEDNGEQLEKFLKDVSAASVVQEPVTSFGKYGKTCGKLNAKFPSKVPSAAESLNAIQNASSFEANQKHHHRQTILQVIDGHKNSECPVQSSPATMVGSNLRRTKTHGRGKGNVDVLDIESFKTDSDEEVSL